MDKFLKNKFAACRKEGKIKPCAPKVPGKNALIFVTYSGPHTGIDEATPTGKYMRQFFEHLGFTVLCELGVLSESHGSWRTARWAGWTLKTRMRLAFLLRTFRLLSIQ